MFYLDAPAFLLIGQIVPSLPLPLWAAWHLANRQVADRVFEQELSELEHPRYLWERPYSLILIENVLCFKALEVEKPP